MSKLPLARNSRVKYRQDGLGSPEGRVYGRVLALRNAHRSQSEAAGRLLASARTDGRPAGRKSATIPMEILMVYGLKEIPSLLKPP